MKSPRLRLQSTLQPHRANWCPQFGTYSLLHELEIFPSNSEGDCALRLCLNLASGHAEQ